MPKKTTAKFFVQPGLARILKERGWSQYKLSKESGVGTATLCRCLARDRRKRSGVSATTLLKLCQTLDVTPAQLQS